MSTLNTMSLNEWLARIESSHPCEIDMGLDRVITVFSKLRLKKIANKVVVVSGTNGKGSTIAMLERLLLDSGLSVGVYTSPHIIKYNERVRINGVDIDDQSLVQGFNQVEMARSNVPLTYFEYGTLCALACLAEASLDIVLLEIGLGGRLDAVNIVDADLSVITSIDIDHTDWLGFDRETIGFEKAGILRQGVPAIYGELNPPKSVTQQAIAQAVPLYSFGNEFGMSSQGSMRSNGKREGYIVDQCHSRKAVVLPECLLPETNILIALQAMECLGFSLTDNLIETSLDNFVVPGRFESVSEKPIVILDVGHNPHASAFLSRRLASIAADRPVYAVFSAMADKDIKGVIKPLSDVVNKWFLGPLETDRAASPGQLREEFDGSSLDYRYLGDLCEAFDTAFDEASNNNGIVICFGSFFVVSCIKQHIARHAELSVRHQ